MEEGKKISSEATQNIVNHIKPKLEPEVVATEQDLPLVGDPSKVYLVPGGGQGVTADDIDFSTIFPIGSVMAFNDDEDHSNHLGLVWERFAQGRTLVGKSSDTEFDTVGKTGGSKTVTLTVDQIPSHSHTIRESNAVSGSSWNLATEKSSGSNTTSRLNNTGGGQAHNNLQPYVVVNYWVRTQ